MIITINSKKNIKILVAEDEPDISLIYKITLEDRGHEVVLANDEEECLRIYGNILSQLLDTSQEYLALDPPFDAVILDYRMPYRDGLETARFILEVNQHQRIIFGSAYVMSTSEESVKYLYRVVELVQKPFEMDVLVDIIEDKCIYVELEKINVDLESIKDLNPTHEQIRDLLEGLRELHVKSPLVDCAK